VIPPFQAVNFVFNYVIIVIFSALYLLEVLKEDEVGETCGY